MSLEGAAVMRENLKLLGGPTSQAKLEIQIFSWKLPILRTLYGPNKTHLWATYTLWVTVCYSDLNLSYLLGSPLLHRVFLPTPPPRATVIRKLGWGWTVCFQVHSWLLSGDLRVLFHPQGLSLGECTHKMAAGSYQIK